MRLVARLLLIWSFKPEENYIGNHGSKTRSLSQTCFSLKSKTQYVVKSEIDIHFDFNSSNNRSNFSKSWKLFYSNQTNSLNLDHAIILRVCIPFFCLNSKSIHTRSKFYKIDVGIQGYLYFSRHFLGFYSLFPRIFLRSLRGAWLIDTLIYSLWDLIHLWQHCALLWQLCYFMSELLNVYSMGRVYSGLVQSTQRLNPKDCHWQTLKALSRSKAIWSASCMIVFCRRASKTRHTNPGKSKVFTIFISILWAKKYLIDPNGQAYWDHDQDCPQLISVNARVVLESSIYLYFWNVLPAAFHGSIPLQLDENISFLECEA